MFYQVRLKKIFKWNDLGESRTHAELPGTHYVLVYIAGFDKRLYWFYTIHST